MGSGGLDVRGHGHELGQFLQVLSGGGEEDLVAGVVGPAKASSVESEDALEVARRASPPLPASTSQTSISDEPQPIDTLSNSGRRTSLSRNRP